jgi:Animal haem peroxidase
LTNPFAKDIPMTLIKGTHDVADPSPQVPGNRGASYCYLFPTLAEDDINTRLPDAPDDETMKAILTDFADKATNDKVPEHPPLMQVPAAYTYFGQFLNHDMSAPYSTLGRNGDTVGVIDTADPPNLVKDFRLTTDRVLALLRNQHRMPMTLGSLYGDGPGTADREMNALYDPDGLRFRLGTVSHLDLSTLKVPEADITRAIGARDILREGGKPLLADLRNDGNLILSQLHLAFLLFHNKLVLKIAETEPNPVHAFRQARREVTLLYQYLIVNDYLPRILWPDVLKRPLGDWTTRLRNAIDVPLEFTTAAFRFGHSMVGNFYDFNANFGVGSRFSPNGAELEMLFDFTSHGTMGGLDNPTHQLPDHWVIDWDRLTRPPIARDRNSVTGLAEQLDMHFALPMLNSAGSFGTDAQRSILFRNLMRGYFRRMPMGQDLALKYDINGRYRGCNLTPDLILKAMPGKDDASDPGGETVTAAAQRLKLHERTPAWLYLLCEAKMIGKGEKLGPLASSLIAETILGLLMKNPASVLNQPGWHPSKLPNLDGLNEPLTTLRAFLMFAVKDTALPA